MLRPWIVISAIVVAVTGVGAVQAQNQSAAQSPTQDIEPAGPSDNARFTFYRLRDNFLRLDVQNGQVAACGWTTQGWYCRVVPDERLALEAEIYRLQHDNVAMKKALLEHGLPLPDGIGADVPRSTPAGGELRWPRAADLDRVTGAMGELWRRMVQMMAKLQRDMLRKS